MKPKMVYEIGDKGVTRSMSFDKFYKRLKKQTIEGIFVWRLEKNVVIYSCAKNMEAVGLILTDAQFLSICRELEKERRNEDGEDKTRNSGE